MPRRFGFLLLLMLAAGTYLCAQSVPASFRVSGRVVNAKNGQPVASAELWLAKASDSEGTLQKLLTGDDGVFAFTVATPGKYLLSGQANGYRRQLFEQHGNFASAIVVGKELNTENVIFRMHADARVLGVIEDEGHEAVPDASVYLFRTDASFGLRQTTLAARTTSDDRGRYRLAHLEPGRYYIVVTGLPWFSGEVNNEWGLGKNPQAADKPEFYVAYPTAFYPGVRELESAEEIVLKEGEDFTADVKLELVRGLQVRVNHVSADPEKRLSASLQQRMFGTTITQMPAQPTASFSGGNTADSSDDSVEVRGVAPGRYLLEMASFDSAGTHRRLVPLNLATDTEVDAESTAEVPSIRGVVRLQGGQNLGQQAFVRLWDSRSGKVLESSVSNKGEINFENEWLTPGTYSVYAMNGANSIVSSLKATGAKVAGQTVQIPGGKPVELEIELASSPAKITGTARRKGKPISGAMILLVPENAEINLPKFRRDQSDSDGTFTLIDVLPGRYRVLAMEDGWDLEWADISVLKKQLERAQKIEVGASQSYRITVSAE